jgi:DNA-binding PadR family transcriptional regulator
MDVKTLCLGFLSLRDACGYDLKKEFESLFRHFFPAGYGSIYPALADLAATGLVECREVAQAGKPDRKVYRITPAGRARFAATLRDAEPQHKLRSEFLAMIYFADLMGPQRLRELLRQRVNDLRAAVDHIDQIEAEDPGLDSAGARFVAGFGAAVARAAAQYIEANQDALLAEVGGQTRCRSADPQRAESNRTKELESIA